MMRQSSPRLRCLLLTTTTTVVMKLRVPVRFVASRSEWAESKAEGS